MSDVVLRRFQPIHLKIEGVGPFRSAFELPLTGPDGAPANFFLLVSKNGFGKTTVLETIYGLMAQLCFPVRRDGFVSSAAYDLHPDLMQGGRAQLDVRIELEGASKSISAVLSLFAGVDQPLRTVTPSLLEQAQASVWFPVRMDRAGSPKPHFVNVADFNARDFIRPFLEDIRLSAQNNRFIPNGNFFLPTALFFTADRQLSIHTTEFRSISQPDFAYAPAHKFTTDGRTWESSMDSLLVWYEWLDVALFEEARDLVNKLLFVDGRKRLVEIDRRALTAVIEVEHEDGTIYRHGIDRLSHGERSLMHLLIRSAYHRTGGTILMIDEMETHLHPKWQHRVMGMLKDWIRRWPDLTVIATTHQPEMMEAFAHQRPEDGLVKGGYLIDASDL